MCKINISKLVLLIFRAFKMVQSLEFYKGSDQVGVKSFTNHAVKVFIEEGTSKAHKKELRMQALEQRNIVPRLSFGCFIRFSIEDSLSNDFFFLGNPLMFQTGMLGKLSLSTSRICSNKSTSWSWKQIICILFSPCYPYLML